MRLWDRLLELEGRLAVTWRHVRGHRPKKDTSDDARYNREVDALAGEARRGVVVPSPKRGSVAPPNERCLGCVASRCRWGRATRAQSPKAAVWPDFDLALERARARCARADSGSKGL